MTQRKLVCSNHIEQFARKGRNCFTLTLTHKSQSFFDEKNEPKIVLQGAPGIAFISKFENALDFVCFITGRIGLG